jgi:hypothetical protein
MTEEENKPLLALYELAPIMCSGHLDNINQPDPAVQYCMEQAKFHLKTAHELLEAAVLNPQTQYDDDRVFYQRLSRVLPLMVLMQSFDSPPPDPVEEGNSQIRRPQSCQVKIFLSLMLHPISQSLDGF